MWYGCSCLWLFIGMALKWFKTKAANLGHHLVAAKNNFAHHFNPSLLSVAFMLAGLMLLLGLAGWQMWRLAEKNTLIANVNKALAQAPQPLTYTPHSDDKLDFKRVRVQGEWLGVQHLAMSPRTYKGAVGYHLVAPLRLKDGGVILVNLGFVPQGKQIAPSVWQGKGLASAHISGILRIAPTQKPWGFNNVQPSNNQGQKVWFWYDLPKMAQNLGVNKLAPVVLYADRVKGYDNYPIAGQAPLKIRNEHRNYAATWLSMALAWLVIWVLQTCKTGAAKAAATPLEKTADEEAENA
jgi:surfeit locus 1 family protein